MSGVTQPLPKHLHDLITNMEFVGAIPKSYKMCIKNRYYVHKDSYIGSIQRWMADESYSHTSGFIDDIVDNFAHDIHHYKSNKKLHDLLMSTGLKFRDGVLNLIDTYADTPQAVALLKKSLSVLDLKIPDEVKQRHGILLPSGLVNADEEDKSEDDTLPLLTDARKD